MAQRRLRRKRRAPPPAVRPLEKAFTLGQANKIGCCDAAIDDPPRRLGITSLRGKLEQVALPPRRHVEEVEIGVLVFDSNELRTQLRKNRIGGPRRDRDLHRRPVRILLLLNSLHAQCGTKSFDEHRLVYRKHRGFHATEQIFLEGPTCMTSVPNRQQDTASQPGDELYQTTA